MDEEHAPNERPSLLDAAPKSVAPYAQEALEAGLYREAIKHFRTLAQTQPASVWGAGLAEA